LQPYQTDDIDVFLFPSVASESGLASLEPIYSYLDQLGYHAVKEGALIEDWLVQFVPAFASVQEEAVTQAERVMYEQTHTYIFGPEHLAAELLRSGRRKDQARVVDLIEAGKLNIAGFHDIVRRHGLIEKWQEFAARFDLEA
jgi:hypothetical protein